MEDLQTTKPVKCVINAKPQRTVINTASRDLKPLAVSLLSPFLYNILMVFYA